MSTTMNATMDNVMTIRVSQPSIMVTIREYLSTLKGVTIEEPWYEEPEVAASIRRGEEDLANGRSTKVTAKDVRAMLGV